MQQPSHFNTCLVLKNREVECIHDVLHDVGHVVSAQKLFQLGFGVLMGVVQSRLDQHSTRVFHIGCGHVCEDCLQKECSKDQRMYFFTMEKSNHQLNTTYF